jgi:predicted MFS family arabinose efflux permease
VRSTLTTIGRQIERALTGPLPEDVRHNLRIEVVALIAYGIFYAVALSFMPVVLRRLGASSGLLAFYTAQTYIGSILSTLGVVLMRRRHPLAFAVTCWLCGRGLLIWAFLITQAGWLLALTAVFWLLEAIPGPAYTRIIQAIYPVSYRGRALAVARVGMVLAILIATPLAGLGLDYLGYQILFPIAGATGVLAALLFTRLRIQADALPPQPPRSLAGIWALLGQNRRFTIYLISFSIYGLGFLMGLPLFAIVQVDRLQLSYTELGYLGLTQALFWLLGNMYWGRQVDRRGGAWVLRLNIAIAMIVPFCYIWAFNAWTLLPAFMAHGIISAGMDLGVISTGIELAGPDQVVEYSALQSTIIGLRGVVGPFVGIGLMNLGLAEPMIFAIGCALIAVAWLCMGSVVPSARVVAVGGRQ